MGVDCKIELSADARVFDVAIVMGQLAGLPLSEKPYVDVTGVQVQPASLGCANILLSGEMVDGEKNHHVLYHFEGPRGTRLLLPPSTPFWCAVADGLIEFFGGRVDYDDCDEVKWDREVPHPEWPNDPVSEDENDNRLYEEYQRRLRSVKPIKVLRTDVACYKTVGG
jgi:hypothetical protein